MAPRMKAADLLLPLGRFSRTQFSIVLLAAAVATGLLWMVAWEIYIVWAFVMFWVGVVAISRRLHDLNHSGYYFLVIVVPLVNIGFLLYLLVTPTAAVDLVERNICLEYYTKEVRLRLFQEREAERFIESLDKYKSTIASHRVSQEQLTSAGARVRAATREVWRRRAEQLNRIPEQAIALHIRGQDAQEAFEAWSEAQVIAIEQMAAGGTPASAQLKMLQTKSQKARKEARREEKRFLRRVRLHPDAVQNMVVNPLLDEDDLDNWRPDNRSEGGES